MHLRPYPHFGIGMPSANLPINSDGFAAGYLKRHVPDNL